MNNSDDVLISMLDTIDLFLQEATTADKSTKCQLLLQTDSFFKKVMVFNPESPQFPRLLQCIHSFFQSLESNLFLFFADKGNSKSLSDLILFFTNSTIAPRIANDISSFTKSFLLINDLNEENASYFHNIIHVFFKSSAFAVPFEAEGGLSCIWKLLTDPSKNNLFEIIYSDLHETIHLYFQTNNSEKAKEFYTTVIELTKDIPISNSKKAFQFIYDLISANPANILLPFIDQGCFTSLNQYIVDHNDPNLLVLYQMFMPLFTSPKVIPEYPDEVHPIIGQLIKLFEFPELPEPLQKSSMKILQKSLTLFSKEYCPIQSESLYIVASSIKADQKELALLLFQISYYLMTHFDFDITLTIPLFFPFYDYNFFVENDVQQLFEVLKMAEDSFLPFVPLFFTSITKNIAPDQFFDLINKYPTLLEFMNIYVNDNIFNEHLLTLFYSISPLFKEREMYSKVLIQLLMEEEKIDFLFKFLATKDSSFADSILNEISQLFCLSKKLRNSPHSALFLNKMNLEQVSASTIFNIIIGLSGKFYNQKLDTFLIHFLKKHDFFKMNKDELKKLAFGSFLKIKTIDELKSSEHLIFPSLLPFCGDDFKIVYPFDKWICGQYGIDIWLNETGQTIDKFPSITNIANRYLLPKHVKMILEYPKIINDCCRNSFQNNPIFEFADNLANTMISFALPESVRSVSFWFSINTLPKEKLRIASFFNCNLIVHNDTMCLNDSEHHCNVTVNRWYHVVLIVNDKLTSFTCYVNGKQTLQSNIIQDNKNNSLFDCDYDDVTFNNSKNKKSSNLRFGTASINPIQWYIGGAIRVYSQMVQNDVVEALFSSGVCNVVKNMKPSETFFITADNFVDLFEGMNQKLVNRYLSENSRPVISFPFLSHLQNAYNGGQCILDLIKKRIENEEDQKVNELIDYLIEALCKMQKLQFTNWKLNTFAVHMSTIFYLRPSLFNENILSKIFACFSSDMNDTINWEDVLVFIFDFGLFNSSNRSFSISKLFEFTAQCSFDENIKSNLLTFIFRILFFFDKELEDSEFDILLSLIDKFHPTNSQISYILQASLDFKDNLTSPTFQYKKEHFEGRIYKSLYEMFINSVDDKFCDYHLIYILQPIHSIELIKKILHLTPKKKIPTNIINQMIIFCLSHSEIKESWIVLLNLLLTVKSKKMSGQFIDSIETLITNSQIDSESLFSLVIALSFLSIQVLNQPDEELKQEKNYWMNLWVFLYSFTFSNASMFNSDFLTSKKNFASIIQLLSLGLFKKEKVVFPFCPSLENPEEILEYSIKPSQPFPNDPAKNLIRANLSYKPKNGNEILTSVSRIIPQTHQLPPPYSEASISSHRKYYEINLINKSLDANKLNICDHWHKFIPKSEFSIEKACNSQIFKDIINLVVKICSGLKLVDPKATMKRSSSSTESLSLLDSANNSSVSIDSASNLLQNNEDDEDDNQANLIAESSNSLPNIPMDFNRFFLAIVTFNECIDTKYTLKVISRFSIEILKFLISKKKIGFFILRYICRRMITGWFEPQSILDLMTNILSFPMKGKEKVLKYVIEILIFESPNIPKEKFGEFLTLFVTNSEKIFVPINFEYDWFIVLMFELLYSNKSRQEFAEQITKISKTFADSLKSNRKKVKDKEILQMRDMIMNGLLEISNASKRESYKIDDNISKLINDKKEEFLTTTKKKILESLKQDILQRNAQTSYFYQNMNEFLDIYNAFDVSARSIASIVRFDDRRLLLFDLNYFFRLREKVLTSFPFADNKNFKGKTTTKTVSLLNDPINPTRRFERSPVIYRIPPFPSVSKTVVSVMPYPLPEYEDILSILPKEIYDLLSVNYQAFEVMVLHQFKPYILSFSYHFEIDDALLLATVLNFVTKEKETKLKFIGDASILYGITPLKGVLIMDTKNIYFIEGLKMTNDGCSFNCNINNEMNDIIYEFYISYIDSGYFGQPYMFYGHPLMQIPMSQIILSTPHLWLQKEFALELNFLLGWTFIIVANNNEDYITLSKSINEFVDHNLGKYHLYNKYPSPINNSRLLKLSVRDVSKLWVDGHISNSTYLLYLNKISGRSFTDFSQFNIFPWLISDYSTSLYESIPEESFRNLSLPMGQIGPERTPRFQLFFEMSKYFYGTHYMHLGVVLFYLFRIDPFCLFSIYFHHGWDHPSRLFSDFTEAWLSAAHVSQNDVKEIVPQMFRCPEFLINISHLPLSDNSQSNENSPNQQHQQPQTPHNVENVKFGRWSQNPRDFTRICSIELESDRVSKTINNWIDLIFGYKSRGEPAIEAKNVFPPLCYSDHNTTTNSSSSNTNQPDERNLIEEEVERKANEASIINFGQCPRQIFKNPHPTKSKFEPRIHLLSDPRLVLYQTISCSAFIPSALPAGDVFIGSTNIFISPKNGLVLNSTTTIMFSHDLSSIVAYSNGVFNSISVAKAKAKAKKKAANSKGNQDTETDDSDDEDSNLVRLALNSPSSLPSIKSVIPLQAEDSPNFFDSSLSSSYQEFSNLVASIDNDNSDSNNLNQQPSLLTLSSDQENIQLRSNSSLYQSQSLHQNSSLDFTTSGRMKILFKCPSSVSFICKSNDGSLLSLFLKEGSFSVYSLLFEKGEVKSGVKLMRFSTSSNEVITASISSLHFLAVVVCNDEQKGQKIARFDLGLMLEVEPINVGFCVRKIAIDDHAATIIACGDDEIAIFTVSGDEISRLKLNNKTKTTTENSSANATDSTKIEEKEESPSYSSSSSSKIESLAIANLEDHINNRFFVTGHDDGFVRFWSLDLSSRKIVCMREFRVCNTKIDLVSISSDDDNSFEVSGIGLRAVAFASNPPAKMFSFEFYGSMAKKLRKEYAVRCAVCGRRFDEIKQKPGVCNGCNRFFCKDCVQKGEKRTLISNELCKNCFDLKNKLAENANDL